MAKNEASKKEEGSSTASWGQIIGLITEKISCTKICAYTDVAHGTTRIIHRPHNSTQVSELSEPRRISTPQHVSEKYICSQCGQKFPQFYSLECHLAFYHAVTELGADDPNFKIVEKNFRLTWLNKGKPIREIERILKVNSTQSTIKRFEDHRASVINRCKSSASRSLVAVDGNEVLGFHATTVSCALGLGGYSRLCALYPDCGICNIIRHGLEECKMRCGIRMTSASSRADESLVGVCLGTRRAAILCRVIAGMVKPSAAAAELAGSYDSFVASGAFSDMEELYVAKSSAILACFVVIYRAGA